MPSMEDSLFQLKFCAKQLERESKRSEKEHNQNKAKIKKALQQGNVDGARIYSENAIRKRSESLNYLRMSARVDGVASRIKTAMAMKQMSKDMGHVVKGLDKAMASMDLQKVQEIMDKFESQTENLDVAANAMDQSMGNATTLSTPADQVDSLIQQVADEHGLEMTSMLSDAATAPTDSIGVASSSTSVSNQQEDALTRRLAQLRN
ncbi:charged multivesicular body protein 1a-like [Bolinopsis microptera]|uniref:charged multivesicular body protein 1a-like n=1 Tax=Bolinopsis microptera TaxID=2820187 RepID=UPI00307AD235